MQLMQLGTIEGRMNLCRLRAERLGERLDNANNAVIPDRANEIKKESKDIMKEYLVLNNLMNKNIPSYQEETGKPKKQIIMFAKY